MKMEEYEVENGLIGMNVYVNLKLLKIIADKEFREEVKSRFRKNRNSQINNKFYHKNLRRYENDYRRYFKEYTNKTNIYIYQVNPFIMNVPFIIRMYLSTCNELFELVNHNYLRNVFKILFNRKINAYRNLNDIYKDWI
jgi:hypothetical protein